jgi:NAD(P)-dependent dehydrogenase (short-subunit alcohol dehydrogenase family)
MSLYAHLRGKGPSGFGYGSTADDVSAGLDLTGRRYLVTGATSGIGLETVRVLRARGASVLAAARSAEKVRAACADLPGEGELVPLSCELSDPASVRACVEQVRRTAALDGIIANAGIMALPSLEQKHGLELQFLTNHMGHFLLVTGLTDRLADDGRVVMLSSEAHRSAPREGIEFDNLSGDRRYGPWRAYGQAKLANLLFARHLAKRFQGTRRTAFAVHPGVIATNLFRHMGAPARLAMGIAKPLFLKTVPQGAATQVWAAVHPDAPRHGGEYLADCNVARPSAQGRDVALAERLWTESERIAARLA